MTLDWKSARNSWIREFPLRLSRLRSQPVSMRMLVPSLVSLSGLRIQHCRELWLLWRRLTAAALTQPLAWELPYAPVVAPPQKKKEERNVWIIPTKATDTDTSRTCLQWLLQYQILVSFHFSDLLWFHYSDLNCKQTGITDAAINTSPSFSVLFFSYTFSNSLQTTILISNESLHGNS